MIVFWTTVQIVLGILSPIILIIVLVFITSVAKSMPAAMAIKAEEMKKQPPFDDVEVSYNPIDRTATARFIKNEVCVWQGNIPRPGAE